MPLLADGSGSVPINVTVNGATTVPPATSASTAAPSASAGSSTPTNSSLAYTGVPVAFFMLTALAAVLLGLITTNLAKHLGIMIPGRRR